MERQRNAATNLTAAPKLTPYEQVVPNIIRATGVLRIRPTRTNSSATVRITTEVLP